MGYAFVNFVTADAMLKFRQEREGQKWYVDYNNYTSPNRRLLTILRRGVHSSEKTVQTAYAARQWVSILRANGQVAKRVGLQGKTQKHILPYQQI